MKPASRARPADNQRGISLLTSLVLLVAVSLLGLSAAGIALMGEKSARNERDRQLALQSAEAALLDAERDIGGSGASAGTRSAIFSSSKADGFVKGCARGIQNPHLGLCLPSAESDSPVWLQIDLLDESSASMASVPYGKFTGQKLDTGQGPLPAKPPRYIIELMAYRKPGENAAAAERSHVYRITAIGFGMQESTRSVLQTIYRKAD